jgi:hypothetical protein
MFNLCIKSCDCLARMLRQTQTALCIKTQTLFPVKTKETEQQEIEDNNGFYTNH